MYTMKLGLACDLCGDCIEVCPVEALTIVDNELKHNGRICTYCEACMDVCSECAIRIYDEI